jgi:SAM-dependent methyltransferase
VNIREYVGRFAQLYDLFYADKPYATEAAFVARCLERWGKNCRRVLELACGTGQHAFLLEQHGYEVVASDRSPDMIAQAEAKRQARGSGVRFVEADMRGLSIPGPPFDAVVCLFDSLGYAVTNEAIAGVLARVHDHLRPGGLFLCEFWHAPAMLRHHDPFRCRRWPIAGGEVLRLSESALDFKQQTCTVCFTVLMLDAKGTYVRHQEKHVNRYFSVAEMRLLLSAARLTPVAEFAGFCEGAVIDDTTWHVLTLAQKE